jgi:hypothetical protein
VLNAAKRVSKKRGSGDSNASVPAPSPKKIKSLYGPPLNPAELEASLALPGAERDEEILNSAVIYTNRAPLVLAFACTLLKYTMPEQPISSRLSLAQAVTSMNSKNKAISIGIDKGQAAEDEGWGEGQPTIKIMTRDIRVMKRWGYEWEEEVVATQSTLAADTPETSQTTVTEELAAKEPALWGIDLEAFKKHSTPSGPGAHKPQSLTQLPIFTAQSARAYLMKAFENPPGASEQKGTAKSQTMKDKERNLSMVLGALELLYESWLHVLSKEGLNQRAWGWYVKVRPDVEQGPAGWGGKGSVKLADILALRRPAD